MCFRSFVPANLSLSSLARLVLGGLPPCFCQHSLSPLRMEAVVVVAQDAEEVQSSRESKVAAVLFCQCHWSCRQEQVEALKPSLHSLPVEPAKLVRRPTSAALSPQGVSPWASACDLSSHPHQDTHPKMNHHRRRTGLPGISRRVELVRCVEELVEMLPEASP